jgi:ribosomal protein L16 Arg81 hydroxylase
METGNYDQNDESDIEQKVKAHIIEQENQKNYFEPQQQQHHHHQKSSPSLPTPNYSSQINCMQEEILHLRAQIALLQSELACRDYTHEKVTEEECDDQNCTDCKNEENENDKSNYTSDDLCETADIFDVAQQQQQPASTASAYDQLNDFSRLSISQCRATTKSKEMPVPKVAERVKLKRTMEDNQCHITGNELTSKDVS